eukprot:m51a1_g3578 putative signal recognition particle 54 kda protein 2-like (479) ;mRNA; r:1116717-1118604
MVLNELGNRISAALHHLVASENINQEAFDEMLKEVCNALISSDVNVQLVMSLRKSIRARANLQEMAAGLNRGKVITDIVFDELCRLLDTESKPAPPRKGRPNVFMFVGLQGSGKTTTVTKLARYYKRKGFKPGLVCADTFRAGAYAQLKQNATKARVPFFGSDHETDPAKVAADGVERFRADGTDLIIVDTSGRHKQEEDLFVEMEQVATAVKPDLIIFVMDGAIGQAAHDQALAFKQRVPVGAVIITKLDGHAKGGGALSAVAATKSPIIFIGTGERMEDLEEFDATRFVQRLLGKGDVKSLVDSVKDVMPKKEQDRIADRLRTGKLTLRDLKEQLQYAMKMGPIDKMIQCLPGFSNMQLPEGADATGKLKNFINVMDSMTDDELDDQKLMPLCPTRIERIARGSGRPVIEVQLLLEQYKMFEKIGKIKQGRSNIPTQRSLSQISQMLPQGVLQQMGGVSGLSSLMRSLNMAEAGKL